MRWRFAVNIISDSRFLVKGTTRISRRLSFLYSQVRQSARKMAGENTIYDDIKQSQEDKRDYRGLLLENGMKVLLISDPSTDKSSAALQVGVGNMSDPHNLPGLAHFCEHMLFLGTEKYPDEEEYKRFLNEHGGTSNASTSSRYTNYFFDVAPEGLQGALDRFAQFFICPLFTASATEREVNAVNSENEKNVKMDSRRLLQVEKITYDQVHPYSHFGTGNKDTLMTRPREAGIDVRQELLAFHKRYYSANIMTLAVLGKETLSDLETLVTDLFAEVKNNSVEVKDWSGHPLGPKQTQSLINVVPVKDLRSLRIQWPLPDLHKHYKMKPTSYFSHLLGHEGPGSVYSEIRRRGWATSLSAGGARHDGFGFFKISVDLSEEGLDHTTDIVTLIFQYINMLHEHGPQEWIHEERKELNAVKFRFKDKEQPRNYTVHCASDLQDYPIPEVLCGHIMIEEYKPEVLSELLEHLKPDNCRIIVSAKKFEGQTDQAEPWYGVPYSKIPLEKDVIETWKNCGLHESLHLPTKNQFIPSDFELVERSAKACQFPKLMEKTDMMELWYCQDDVFLLPKACISVTFMSPEVYASPEHVNLMAMFERLFIDSVNEQLYSASIAGLYYDFITVRNGFKVVLGGYNDKLKVLLQKLVDHMVHMEVDPDRFSVLKEKYIRGLQNYDAEQPHSHASYYTDVFLAELMWTRRDKLAQAHNMTASDLEASKGTLLNKLYAKMLVYGNVDKEEALGLSQVLTSTFEGRGTTSLPEHERPLSRAVQLTDGGWQGLREENRVHATCALKVYYQVGMQATADNMHLELLAQVAKQRCFDTLRTKEQLGYIVFSGVTRHHGTQGYYVTVQSTRSPHFLETRVDLFLAGLRTHLMDMTEDVFNNHKEALASRRLEKPKNLQQQHGRYMSEISSNFYFFNRDEEEVAYLKSITKDQLIKFYEKHIAVGGPQRRKLSVYVPSSTSVNAAGDGENGDDIATTCSNADSRPVTIYDLNSLPGLKKTLAVYPPPSPVIPLTVSKL